MTLPSPDGAASPPGRSTRAWHAELAWLPGLGVLPNVLIEATGDRFSAVTAAVSADAVPAGTIRLAGLTMPGLANGHSHAFHRALRGSTGIRREQESASDLGPGGLLAGLGPASDESLGSFWTWRERMYQVAERLDPDSYLALARAVYAEMALAGIACVGEFHYVHHGPGGQRYDNPNAMSLALIEAAGQAGLRLTLLDTCYLSGGLDSSGGSLPLDGPQLRFADGTAEGWAKRIGQLGADEHGKLGPAARLGAAIHSVRAVPPEQMHVVTAWTHRAGAPLHVHLGEQVAENESSLAAYRATPSAVLYDAGVLGPRTTVVHATHVTPADIKLLGGSEVFACVCPTTEAELADGIGPFGPLAAAGCRLTVGSDSQAVIDLFEEARRIELYQRLATSRRGWFGAEALGRAVTWDGHASLGWPDAGEIAPGSLADLVTVSLDSVRLAGVRAGAGFPPAAGFAEGTGFAPGAGPATTPGVIAPPEPDLAALHGVMFAASSADVRNVVIGGRDVVADGRHLLVGDVPGALRAAVRAVLAE
jgi:formiminoglutamate deiminase